MMIVSTDCFVVYQFHIHQQRFSIRTGCTGCFASRYYGQVLGLVNPLDEVR
jgi:hypothetical protein